MPWSSGPARGTRVPLLNSPGRLADGRRAGGGARSGGEAARAPSTPAGSALLQRTELRADCRHAGTEAEPRGHPAFPWQERATPRLGAEGAGTVSCFPEFTYSVFVDGEARADEARRGEAALGGGPPR